MEYYGYAGQILNIDLGIGEIKKEPLDNDLSKYFVGGFGINTMLAYDLIQPNVAALSPDNVIIIGAGALAGTMAPGSARLVATTKFPQTGTIASGNGSLRFAAQLKYAGYDHLIITGKASKPTYLKISSDRIEFCDATYLWGRDLVETTEELWREHGKHWSVIAIGQAGENLVSLSLTLIDRTATLGKGGLGAVMGSKNLKAVMISGNKGIRIAYPNKYFKLVNKYLEQIRAFPSHKQAVEEGKMWGWSDEADFYYRNRTELYPKEKVKQHLGMEVYIQKVKRGRVCCPSCPLADKDILGVNEGEFEGLLTYTSGFPRRNVDFGILCEVGGYDRIIKCLDTANRYGLDTHSFSFLFDYIVQLYEQGVITHRDTGGIELKRDYDTTMELIKKITFREGFGDLLADGELAIINRFGAEAAREAIQAKGLEIMVEPRIRGLTTLEFETVLNPRGGHHHAGDAPVYTSGDSPQRFITRCRRMGITPEAISRIMDATSGFNVGRLSRYAEDWYAVLSSLGLCNMSRVLRFYSIEICAELYTATTGMELSYSELATAGERIWNVKKASNVRAGFTRKDDYFPPKWFQPLKGHDDEELRLRNYWSGETLSQKDVEKLLDDYYEERGWLNSTGIPSSQKLVELGLKKVAHDLSSYQNTDHL